MPDGKPERHGPIARALAIRAAAASSRSGNDGGSENHGANRRSDYRTAPTGSTFDRHGRAARRRPRGRGSRRPKRVANGVPATAASRLRQPPSERSRRPPRGPPLKPRQGELLAQLAGQGREQAAAPPSRSSPRAISAATIGPWKATQPQPLDDVEQERRQVRVADVGARGRGQALPVEERQDPQHPVPAAGEEDGGQRRVVGELVKCRRAARGRRRRRGRCSRRDCAPARLEARAAQSSVDAAREPHRIDRSGERRDADAVTGADGWRARARGICKGVEEPDKPSSVSGGLTTAGHGHSSGTGVAAGLERPTRGSRPGEPERAGRAARAAIPLFGLAPHGVCRAPDRHRPGGALLPHRFTLTWPRGPGGLFSVALSVASPRLAVGEHAARWSPDFPLHANVERPRRALRPGARYHLLAAQPSRRRKMRPNSPPSTSGRAGFAASGCAAWRWPEGDSDSRAPRRCTAPAPGRGLPGCS